MFKYYLVETSEYRSPAVQGAESKPTSQRTGADDTEAEGTGKKSHLDLPSILNKFQNYYSH